MASAATYMVRASLKDGRFLYEVNGETNSRSKHYSATRHAGALYALAELDHTGHNSEIEDAIKRSSAYLLERYLGPGPFAYSSAIWSTPGNYNEATLGASALAVVALCSARRSDPSIVTVETLQSLGHFLLRLQRNDGSFIEAYEASTGMDPDMDVLYYPGEAALAFVYLYELDASRTWLNAASKALSFLAARSGRTPDVPADAWSMIAMEKLFRDCASVSCVIPRASLIHFAKAITSTITTAASQTSGGALEASRRTTPTASRLEALCAAIALLPECPEKLAARRLVIPAAAFLMESQIKIGPYKGAIPQSENEAEAGHAEIRIDYTQHALCAWLRLAGLISSGRLSTAASIQSP